KALIRLAASVAIEQNDCHEGGGPVTSGLPRRMSARTRAIPGRRPTCSISVFDWGTRKAAWCAIDEHGDVAEGATSADEDGLARLVYTLGPDVRGCVEMMSGAVWVRDRLAASGWAIQIAEPRKVEALAPLAWKTDRVDARGLAEAVRPDRVPRPWVPSR